MTAESKIRAMPVNLLRDIVGQALHPFIRGGLQAGEKDSDLYSLHLMDKSGLDFAMDIPMKVRLALRMTSPVCGQDGSVVDLLSKSGNKGFSLQLVWDVKPHLRLCV